MASWWPGLQHRQDQAGDSSLETKKGHQNLPPVLAPSSATVLDMPPMSAQRAISSSMRASEVDLAGMCKLCTHLSMHVMISVP